MTTQSRRRALAVGALVTGSFLAVLGGNPTPSAASVDLAFNGAAGAEGMRVQVIVPSAPVSSNVFDAGGPVARASLTSGGDAQASAVFPYPGEAPMGGASLAAGALAAGGVPLPGQVPTNYPFAAVADANSPEQTVGSGPFTLRAKTTGADGAEAQASTGLAQDGGPGAGAVASEGSLTRSPENVTALGVFRATAVQAGPLLLGQVIATVQVVLLPDGTTTRTSSLTVSGASVAGTPVVTPPGGAEQTVAALNTALAASKVTVQYLQTQDVPGGLVSGALAITMPFPTGGAQGTARLVLGRASAAIRTEERDAAGSVGVAPSSPVEAGPAPAAEPVADASGPAEPLNAAEGPSVPTAGALPPDGIGASPFGSTASALGGATIPAAAEVPPPAPAPAEDRPHAGQSALGVPAAAQRLNLGSAYAVIALMVMAGAAVNQLTRRIGRKSS